ncbi:Polyketide cyclase/dehydrase and lipid transport superfamily protein isoform 2 [Hibiscus syriacus]|uniref:Polyketide cyclase/dehydrase and lipid transport superfamily protein isoform 2 n=1 Tax=Hibiscus syriacus TaxID=106335 RepID=A0A6A3D6I5_HIBSY|nr:Polyketide cyclase/dehydrase and lipid transport superfamily protein isoform 2 [Hibiscus syriacus]
MSDICRISEIVNDSDLKFLIDNLDEKGNDDDKWEIVIDKKNNFLSYRAKCCKPKDRPLKYLSTTVFESCTPDLLRDFYMDNDYRKQWDKTVIDHMQLQVDTTTGIEIGRTVKKFPLLTPREYILAWRLWQGKDRSFYCFIKECEHLSAPRQKKYVRVEYFRSVPGRDASEIRMFHQEDAGLNVEMAKLAFAKGIWNYLCKMDNALRNYPVTNHPPTGSSVSAVTLMPQELVADIVVNIQVPPELDARTGTTFSSVSGSVASDDESKKKLLRRPSKKLVAKSLLLLGGVIYLCRAHSALGGKVTVSYILTKLRKRSDSSSQSSPS